MPGKKMSSSKQARVIELAKTKMSNKQIQQTLEQEFGKGVSNSVLSQIRKAEKLQKTPQFKALYNAFDYIRRNQPELAEEFYNALPKELKGGIDAVFT